MARRLALTMRLARIAAGLFFALACLAGAQAAPIAQKKDELKALREQIQGLQKDIAKGEEDRAEAADQLADSERAISDAQRRLVEISGDRKAVEAEIARLRQEEEHLLNQLAEARKQLGNTLYRIYVEGGEAGARRMLGGKDPNQMSRDAYYLERIAQQRKATIDAARDALDRLQAVQRDAETQREHLITLEHERAEAQQKLVHQRNQRKQVLQTVSARVRAQQREVQNLQRNQARLEKLLLGLERIERERKAAQRAARSAAKSPRSAMHSGKVLKPADPAQPQRSGEAREVAEQDENDSGDDNSGNFARLQGRLRWPVRGELFGRFGTPRPEGGAWHGVFIRAAEGNEVRSIADGRVAYADWLRGFGNLVIVDHGSGYMSIYANNDALLKTPGQIVRTGEPIARVGASGGQDESGLYFEIRHRGQPQDPSRWIAGK